jgi:hypothetical protein
METDAVRRARETAQDGFTFIDAILAGRASEDDADDWVEAWHDNPVLNVDSLEALFGMTWTEYSNWVHDPDSIHWIVRERRKTDTSTDR